MFRYLLLLLALCLPLWSQQGTYNAIQAPDCQFFVYMPSGTTTTVVFDNRTAGCTDWAVTYNSSGYSAVSFLFQSAPNNAGSPGTWGAYGGTTVTGSNPMTATTQTSSTFSGYQPWLRASVTLTGSGIVQGAVYGWRYRNGGGGSSGSGCPDPCPVIGVDAPGAASTADPVQVAGNDGTNVRAIATDTAGRTSVVGASASGAALAGNPVRVGLSDTTNAQNWLTASSLADAGTGAGAGAVGMVLYNGATYDRWRGSTNGAYVQGPVAAGSATAGNPLILGGPEEGGTTVRTVMTKVDATDVGLVVMPARNTNGNINFLLTDLSGGIMPGSFSGAGADASSNSYTALRLSSSTEAVQKSYLYLFNGTTWDRQRGSSTAGTTIGGFGSGASGTLYGATACDTTATISVTAGNTTQIVSLTAGRTIRVCSYVLTASADASQAQWAFGTGTNCGTGTGTLSGSMYMQLGTVISAGDGLGEIMSAPSANALCLAATTGTITGHLRYAKY